MRGFFNYSKLTAATMICLLSFSSSSFANQNTTPTNTNISTKENAQITVITKDNSQDDPLQPYNRIAFNFNTGLNKIIINPIARGYNLVLPNILKKGISNFFSNINTVTTIANDVLQLKLYQAWSDIWRLGVNTTVGVGGLFDVASHMGLERHKEGFGLTLAYWGWENSSYFIIPVIGPSTIRDTFGLGGDYFMSIYPYIHSTALSDGLLALFFISYRAEVVDLQEIEEQAALDPYLFERNAYLQNRKYLIQQNKGMQQPVDNYVPGDDDEIDLTAPVKTKQPATNKVAKNTKTKTVNKSIANKETKTQTTTSQQQKKSS